MRVRASPQPPLRPVVIIGAPRSGTNMLREALCALPGFTTWPCDEINYLWRHGNARLPHDELTPDRATPKIRRYLRRHFARRGRDREYVVEKTCANSLRVPFVNRILPEARFVWIVRDGRDAIPSARRRWFAKLEPRYAAAKARFIPPGDLGYYAAHHVARRIHRLRSNDGRLGSWGPRLAGMDELLASRTLLEVCAEQWRRCVEQSDHDLASLEAHRVHRISYETFVANPAIQLAEIASFAGRSLTDADLQTAVAHVNPQRANAPRPLLTEGEREQLEWIAAPTLATHGYG